MNSIFVYENIQYRVLRSGKPRPQGRGECKTDVYIEAQALDGTNQIREIKISCKLLNSHEFQENKIKAERAVEIFGENWSEIIRGATESIRNCFEETVVYFPFGTAKTKETIFTNGWKLEIANKARGLSCRLNLSEQVIKDRIYKGTTLDDRKKNSKVNGEVVPCSGVAEYILISNPTISITTADILSHMIQIDQYTIDDHYMVFTANNLRVLKNKTDGDRALAVQVIWTASECGQMMTHDIEYSNPLNGEHSARMIANRTISEINKTSESFRLAFI